MNAAEAVEVVTLAVAYWPAWGRLMADDARLELTARAWADYLGDVPKATAVEAMKAAAAERRDWPPPVGVLRGLAMDLLHPDALLDDDAAWSAVQEAIARFGSYRDPEFADPIVDRVVRSMGWKHLCASTNQVADRAHFLQMYRAARDRARFVQDAPASVLAFADSQRELAAPAEDEVPPPANVVELLSRGGGVKRLDEGVGG